VPRVAIFINTCKSKRTKVVPKGLDEIYYGNAWEKRMRRFYMQHFGIGSTH
jgi:hypothetical protein